MAGVFISYILRYVATDKPNLKLKINGNEFAINANSLDLILQAGIKFLDYQSTLFYAWLRVYSLWWLRKILRTPYLGLWLDMELNILEFPI